MKKSSVAVLFAISVFISAFLLFQIQPLISKAILPWFGGTPNVWTTCLLFFQTVLFGGYVYAHLVSTHCTIRWQAIIHSCLLACAVLSLSILPDASWKPTGGESPILSILGVLLVTVGLPYFVLSTTGPLLQSWFSLSLPGTSPYRLYALSNIGSLLALISYPFVFEPMTGMANQAVFWSIGFISLAILCGTCGWVTAATGVKRSDTSDDSQSLTTEKISQDHTKTTAQGGTWWQWFGLSMIASVMLLATTNQVCQDVAVVPFLWVIPLSLYLLTFILCFDGEQWYSRIPYGLGAGFCLALVTFLMSQPTATNLVIQIVIYFSALFAACMVCHGELARLKPNPSRLTAFYLTMAAGGATGGIFVGVIAPSLFPLFFEMHFAIIACVILTMTVYLKADWQREEKDQIPAWGKLGAIVTIAGVGISLQSQAGGMLRAAEKIDRNFYGVIRVEDQFPDLEEDHTLNMRHGRTLHGVQFQHPSRRLLPTTYYGLDSGIGRTIEILKARQPELKIGVVGLGVGTLSAYGRKEDHIRYYEINSAVIEIANSDFTFLSDSESTEETILGDARLVLERESNQNYDLLVLDAFSGDSVPTHLLTKEAIETYQRHLQADGVIAFHISNLHFDLTPVVSALADEAGLSFCLAKGRGDDKSAQVPSTWFICSKDQQLLTDSMLASLERKTTSDRILWTDDFSNLYSIMK